MSTSGHIDRMWIRHPSDASTLLCRIECKDTYRHHETFSGSRRDSTEIYNKIASTEISTEFQYTVDFKEIDQSSGLGQEAQSSVA